MAEKWRAERTRQLRCRRIARHSSRCREEDVIDRERNRKRKSVPMRGEKPGASISCPLFACGMCQIIIITGMARKQPKPESGGQPERGTRVPVQKKQAPVRLQLRAFAPRAAVQWLSWGFAVL